MNIIVCVKQVPGTAQVEVDPDTGVLKRDGTASKLNPYDLYALEAAFSLREAYGGTVRTLSMGPPQAESALLETIYMGADSGVLISDPRFAGADVLSTSYTLAQGIKAMGGYDLILCGKQTTDGDTAQVGAELAEFLDLPHGGNVLTLTLGEDKHIIVKINYDQRIVTQKMPLPCLICVDGDINTPRLPSYKRMKALLSDKENKPIRVLGLNDFTDGDDSHYGLKGSPTQVERIFPPEKGNGREIFTGDGTVLAERLHRLLKDQKYL